MIDLRQAAQQAIEALDSDNPDIQLRAAVTLRAALAQPVQEPLAWLYPEGLKALQNGKCWTAYPTQHEDCNIPLYIAMPPMPVQEPVARVIDNGTPEAAREYLRKPAQQEPVAWICEGSSSDEKHAIDYYPGDVDDMPIGAKLYTSPPAQRPWVGLTEDEKFEMAAAQYGWEDLLIAAEAKLKEKNNG